MQATLAFYSDHNAAVMILQKGHKYRWVDGI